MSPLPEIGQGRLIYTASQERINQFFDRHIGANEVWGWHAIMGSSHEEKELFKLKRVNFEVALEKYTASDKEGGLGTHYVYSTSQKGVYLELVFKDEDRKEIIFHRLGEKANEEYLASITNR